MPIFQYKTNKVGKKQVYYEGTDTLHKGYLLCYNWDTTTDMNGTTVAAGSDCNGKYLRVEKPATANVYWFAGVVAPESDGVIGPAWITVVEPTGVIVQVYTDANVTAGDELELKDSTYLAAAAAGGVVNFCKALETVNRSETNGLVTVLLYTPPYTA